MKIRRCGKIDVESFAKSQMRRALIASVEMNVKRIVI